MTGLIYIVIIALWAVVLIPMWLRRHDQVSEVRSTARFTSAMKTLASRNSGNSVLEMSVPVASRGQEIHMPSPYDRSYDLDPEYERELIRQTAATRRAIVIGVLTLGLLMSLILAVVSVLPKWLPILAALPLGAFIVAAVMTAGARRDSREYRPTKQHEVAAPRNQRQPVGVQPTAAQDDWESWDAWQDTNSDSWTAVPTTLPTYVNAPRATEVPRKIDRSRPGEWTGSAMVETARTLRRPVDEIHAADPPAVYDDLITAEIPVVRPGRAASA